jgi:hypothetical protein
MKLNKNTQILLGVGALAVVGYFVYQNNKSDKKANASGEGFTASVMIPCQFMVAQTDWKIVGNYNGETLYLDNKGIYHWFTKVSGKAQQGIHPMPYQTNQITTNCYENTSSDNPLKFTPKK